MHLITWFCWDKHVTSDTDADSNSSLYSASTHAMEKKVYPVSEQFDLVQGDDGRAGLSAFECKVLFHLRSMSLFTPYLLSCSFGCRMWIPLTSFMGDKAEEGMVIQRR